MSVDKRLSEVFQQSKILTFDDKSKFIFFNDCHRGDNSWADDFAHNEKLFFHAMTHYFDEGYTYIELGDGDELWENKRFSEIRDAHSHVFWLLQKFYDSKKFHLIYGNHNMRWKNQKHIQKNIYKYLNKRSSNKEPLFRGITVHEGLILKHESSQKQIFLVHGHQGDLMCDYLWRFSRFLVRHIWKHLQLLGIRDPTSPAKNYKKQLKVEEKICEWVKKNKQMIICGHTHRSMCPSKQEQRYFNTGSCVHPRCITGIELASSQLVLVKWSIAVKNDGTLYIGRDVLDGPVII